ncbi:concanavalin A-like lectin/glucanase domain-containing protein [Xylariaceae sp. FL0016]|nr:concanavalin A-like lectin/glucanase domain-containing protein [Xylariaceae sp. FL0016]
MFSNLLSTTALALAATQMASAQTFTKCNPMEKSCDPDKAVGKENLVQVDFTKGANDFFEAADGTSLTYGDKGAVFTINKETDAPTIESPQYIWFGKITVELQAAAGTGVVTSFVLQSDDLDEIDWEWLGGDTTQVQTNYFGKGDTTTYDRGAYHSVSSPQTTFHSYEIDWTKDYVRWSIDGTQVRELLYADAQGGTRFPQTPCQIKLGTWDAGSSTAAEGTVQWAGGLTDFSQAPFIGYYKSISIQDYAGPDGTANAKEYVWNSGSDGSYESITVKTTEDSSAGGEDASASTASGTTTSAASSSSSSTGTVSGATTLSTATKSAADFSSTTITGITQATAALNAGSSSNSSQTTSSSSSSTSAGDSTSTTTPVTAGGAAQKAFSTVMLGAGLLVALL